MTTTDPRVGAYIAKSAPFARPILRHLRTLIHRGCPEAREEIKWGMPTFMHHGILCGLGGFKAHVAFWFRRQAMAQMLGPDGARAGEAMGQLGRITSLDDLPGDRAMLGYIRQAAKLNAAGGPARPNRQPASPVRICSSDLVKCLGCHSFVSQSIGDMTSTHQALVPTLSHTTSSCMLLPSIFRVRWSPCRAANVAVGGTLPAA